MGDQRKAPTCTCGNRGECGFCPSIAAVASRQARPYTDPVWTGRHPHNRTSTTTTNTRTTSGQRAA
jgi:hypothetical protein